MRFCIFVYTVYTRQKKGTGLYMPVSMGKSRLRAVSILANQIRDLVVLSDCETRPCKKRKISKQWASYPIKTIIRCNTFHYQFRLMLKFLISHKRQVPTF